MTHALIAIIYLAFVSLGLPDGLLGAAWPAMHADLGAAVSLAGAISVVICLGTIVSSLMTDTLVRRLGTGRLTAASWRCLASPRARRCGSWCSGPSRTAWARAPWTRR